VAGIPRSPQRALDMNDSSYQRKVKLRTDCAHDIVYVRNAELVLLPGMEHSTHVDSERWRRNKGRLVRRILRKARVLISGKGLANCACGFLLSNGATATRFSTATPP
jgi:hypothetical protein